MAAFRSFDLRSGLVISLFLSSTWYDLTLAQKTSTNDGTSTCEMRVEQLTDELNDLKVYTAQIVQQLGLIEKRLTEPRDCSDVQSLGIKSSGVYTVYTGGIRRPINVYCDMNTNGGGWTVFQRRKDGSVDFCRNWINYSEGFGDLTGEFWLGNDNIHSLTTSRQYELRVDLVDFNNSIRYAEYSNFTIDGAADKYRLVSIGTYSGDTAENLARGRPTWQSSTYVSMMNTSMSSDLAVDGNTHTNFSYLTCTHTAANGNPWWAVDLGRSTNVGRVVFYNRQDCCSERANDFIVSLTNDSPAIRTPTVGSYALCGQYRGSVGAVATVTCFDNSPAARYVIVQLNRVDFLTICELEVYERGYSLRFDVGYKFSTFDQDNNADGGSCATGYKGGWWYSSCNSPSLNGLYLAANRTPDADYYSPRFSEMKIRPALA